MRLLGYVCGVLSFDETRPKIITYVLCPTIYQHVWQGDEF